MSSHSFDDKSDAWLEGYQANRIDDHNNHYSAGTKQHADWQEGHDFKPAPLTLDQVALVTPPAGVPPAGRFGYVIGPDATTYTLQYRWYHGIICALLYPELAAKHECGTPISPHDENNVFAFQRFEHDHSNDMQVIRVAQTWMGPTYFSKGSKAATPEQINVVLGVTKALGFTGRAKIETEYGEQTVAQIIDRLREGDA